MRPWIWIRSLFSASRGTKLEQLAEEVAGHWSHLPVLESQVRLTIAEVEKAVVEVGKGFDGMATLAQESVAEAARLLGTEAGAGTEVLMETSRGTLAELMRQSARAREISARLIVRMKQMEGSTYIIVKALEEIDKICFGSKLVAINAKVEAARFGEEGGPFEVVATEIGLQAQRSEEITARLSEEMKRMREAVADTAKDLDGMAHQSLETLENGRRELEDALGRIEQTHHSMQATLASSMKHSEELASEISRAIVAMQFQDRVSQRLSHVADEIGEMGGVVEASLAELSKKKPELGSQRSKEVGARQAGRYTMESERMILSEEAAPPTRDGGDVELF